MAAMLKFDLISPERTLLSKSVTFVTMPGYDGYLGVLEGHAPFIVALTPGVVEVYPKDMTEISDRFFVAGGFAEINGEACTLLAEEAMPVASLNRATLEEEVANLSEDFALAETPEARAPLELKLDIARAKLAAAK